MKLMHSNARHVSRQQGRATAPTIAQTTKQHVIDHMIATPSPFPYLLHCNLALFFPRPGRGHWVAILHLHSGSLPYQSLHHFSAIRDARRCRKTPVQPSLRPVPTSKSGSLRSFSRLLNALIASGIGKVQRA